jgi:hypothetical protein
MRLEHTGVKVGEARQAFRAFEDDGKLDISSLGEIVSPSHRFHGRGNAHIACSTVGSIA